MLTTMIAFMSACSHDSDIEAITCRGGHKDGSQYRVRTIIELRTDSQAISYAPLRCPNLVVNFHGGEPNEILNLMTSTAQRSVGGRATFQIDVIGGIGRNDKLNVPALYVTKVLHFHRIY